MDKLKKMTLIVKHLYQNYDYVSYQKLHDETGININEIDHLVDSIKFNIPGIVIKKAIENAAIMIGIRDNARKFLIAKGCL